MLRPEDTGLNLCPTCNARPTDCLCDMRLPDGRACGDCLHWKRCKGMISSLKYEGKRCDFSPSRFVAARRHMEGE